MGDCSRWQRRCSSSECDRRHGVELPLYMSKRTIPILLTILLLGANGAGAAAGCGDASGKNPDTAVSDCKMNQPSMPSKMMSCCRPSPVSLREDNQGASGCCQMSAPRPDQPRPALPGNSSEKFRQGTRAQLLDSSEPVSPLALTLLVPGWVSSATFCPDRSDTYLLESTFRI
jgi:hypothetical protein